MEENIQVSSDQLRVVEWGEFLEKTPLFQPQKIRKFPVPPNPPLPGEPQKIVLPDLKLLCPAPDCSRILTNHQGLGEIAHTGADTMEEVFVRYICRNCLENRKIFAIHFGYSKSDNSGIAVKIGEWPPPWPPVPSRVQRLIQPDREKFMKGRKAEFQGLGLGAFAYYRRVVEDQKGRLLEKFRKVAEVEGANSEVLKQFDDAIAENQFTKSIDLVKQAIPESLRIDGHNPMVLLHKALSEGIHSQSDQDCLEVAGTIRLILTELAERISQALKDNQELKSSVGLLLARNSKKLDPEKSE